MKPRMTADAIEQLAREHALYLDHADRYQWRPETMTTTYSYTIFDADPASSSGTQWPTHDGIALEADSDSEAIEAVRDVMSVEAGRLSVADDYAPGDKLYAIVLDVASDTIVAIPTYTLTHEDLGLEEESEEV